MMRVDRSLNLCDCWLTLLFVGLLAAPGLAQSDVQAVKLTIQPASAPVPALKYRLFPDPRDMTSGNAAMLYLRALNPEWQTFRHQPDYHKREDRWLEMALKDLAKDAGASMWLTSFVLKEVDLAARRHSCDWELLERAKVDGIALLLPEVQGMRVLARYVSIRTRLHLARGEYTEMTKSLQTGFQMGRHVAQGQTLISHLVGVAITSMMLKHIEEAIGQPGSPNFYWALSELPNPVLDLRPSLDGERLLIEATFPEMRDLRKGEPLPAGWSERFRERFQKVMPAIEPSAGNLRLTLTSIMLYTQSKRQLIARGHKPEDVEKMPVLQVIALNQLETYDIFFDEAAKWVALPYPIAAPGMNAMENNLKAESGNYGALLARLFLPALTKVNQSKARLARQVAMLRVIEALRLHAAQTGKFPEKLSEITIVPIPEDPWTGKSFVYSFKDKVAVLTNAYLEGETPNRNNTFRYELTWEKQ